MKGDTPAEPGDNQDDVPAAPPGLPPYPTIGTVNVERGENPDAGLMVEDVDMNGESSPDSDR